MQGSEGVRLCRQYQDGFYCQAPQTPSYNFSDPNFTPQGASSTPAAATTGRHLLQASNSSATNSTGAPVNTTGNVTLTCNKIKYYGNCGELTSPGSMSWPEGLLGFHFTYSARVPCTHRGRLNMIFYFTS